ncbi:hypothetical protein F2Q69_00036240 [Brassica cretica]|uniref:Uncharacterized protein n=1 Tax=Brassica cretica TaxID=69181 RepID=A0A8S9SCR5_BRACR|nr:hypothetical protein F2Q69_00036240 [Brassica cretica]
MSFSNFFWLLSDPSWTGVFLSPSLGISVSYNLLRGSALDTWRGTDPEFPREFVGAIGFHLHVRWVAGDPGPGSGTWVPGPGIRDLEAGTRNLEMNRGREAVFPALGRDPFEEQLRSNLMSTKRRSTHPAISLILDSTTTLDSKA